MNATSEHWDAFVSHASEDKDSFVRPLVEALGLLGASLWYDETSLRPGDSLSASIDRGITQSRIGIVVISPSFLEKNWPCAELDALMTRKIDGSLRLLPVWLGVTKEEVAEHSSLLADLVAIQAKDKNAQEIAITLLAEVRSDIYAGTEHTELVRKASGHAYEELQEELVALRESVADLLCPRCGTPLAERSFAYDDEDPNQADVEVFQCGHVIVNGRSESACPFDPNFPEFGEYETRCHEASDGFWTCFALPQTDAARGHKVSSGSGRTEAEARLAKNASR